jgi:hypothetical protein
MITDQTGASLNSTLEPSCGQWSKGHELYTDLPYNLYRLLKWIVKTSDKQALFIPSGIRGLMMGIKYPEDQS